MVQNPGETQGPHAKHELGQAFSCDGLSNAGKLPPPLVYDDENANWHTRGPKVSWYACFSLLCACAVLTCAYPCFASST